MPAGKHRLDRYLSKTLNIKRSLIKPILAAGRVELDGETVFDAQLQIHQFNCIVVDGQVLQDKQPIYLMLNKPQGVVSATQDKQHKTVLDLIDCKNKGDLHIPGRLDFNTTGLLLLTNNSMWSQQLFNPAQKILKQYWVRTSRPIDTERYQRLFHEGIYFPTENITTASAALKVLNDYEGLLEISEGKYHQIKRMFAHVGNEVEALKRLSVGHICLDESLAEGDYRPLRQDEINLPASIK